MISRSVFASALALSLLAVAGSSNAMAQSGKSAPAQRAWGAGFPVQVRVLAVAPGAQFGSARSSFIPPHTAYAGNPNSR